MLRKTCRALFLWICSERLTACLLFRVHISACVYIQRHVNYILFVLHNVHSNFDSFDVLHTILHLIHLRGSSIDVFHFVDRFDSVNFVSAKTRVALCVSLEHGITFSEPIQYWRAYGNADQHRLWADW